MYKTQTKRIKVALAGNPNCGKTSIFNSLTGTHQHVGNYPGVTVEKRSGNVTWQNYKIELIDLPGTYGLSAFSLDEKIARDFIIIEQPDLVINVIDSGNLERNLYLTTQLLEMGVDLVIDLNMWDEAEENGVVVDEKALSRMLNAPVVKTVGHKRVGIDKLIEAAVTVLEKREKKHRHTHVTYGQIVDDKIAELTHAIEKTKTNRLPARWYAVNLLEQSINSDDIDNFSEKERIKIRQLVKKTQAHVKKTSGVEVDSIINDGRYGFVTGLLKSTTERPLADRMALSNQIDNLLTHKILSYPIFLLIMWLIFQATYVLGQYPADWIDAGISWLSRTVAALLPSGIINELLVEGVIGGVGSVLVFLPNILILFLGISLLEDSGYMSRAAFIMDRLMRTIGLQGKSFIPLLMGFGCNVPAIMATRTLESHRDRVLTTLLIPFMSCSARLPVFVLFAGAFFMKNAGNVIFFLYLIGILVAVTIGLVTRGTMFKKKDALFVMELPPYRVPTWQAAFIHMWERGKIYLRKMGGVILIASVILWFFGAFPKVESYSEDYDSQIAIIQQSGNENMTKMITELEHRKALEDVQYSFIGRLGEIIEPAIKPLGFNWQMGVSLITGFVAKEVVVSSMGVLYQLGDEVDEESNSLINALQNPIHGITPLVALAFMVFVLLYTPCLTVVVAVRREIGSGWMWVGIIGQLIIAWTAAFVTYNIGFVLGFS